MAMHEKLGGLNIQLLGHIFADFDQVFAAGSAGARLGFMAVLDTRQMSG
jgi:hypothetical protein